MTLEEIKEEVRLSVLYTPIVKVRSGKSLKEFS